MLLAILVLKVLVEVLVTRGHQVSQDIQVHKVLQDQEVVRVLRVHKVPKDLKELKEIPVQPAYRELRGILVLKERSVQLAHKVRQVIQDILVHREQRVLQDLKEIQVPRVLLDPKVPEVPQAHKGL